MFLKTEKNKPGGNWTFNCTRPSVKRLDLGALNVSPPLNVRSAHPPGPLQCQRHRPISCSGSRKSTWGFPPARVTSPGSWENRGFTYFNHFKTPTETNGISHKLERGAKRESISNRSWNPSRDSTLLLEPSALHKSHVSKIFCTRGMRQRSWTTAQPLQALWSLAVKPKTKKEEFISDEKEKSWKLFAKAKRSSVVLHAEEVSGLSIKSGRSKRGPMCRTANQVVLNWVRPFIVFGFVFGDFWSFSGLSTGSGCSTLCVFTLSVVWSNSLKKQNWKSVHDSWWQISTKPYQNWSSKLPFEIQKASPQSGFYMASWGLSFFSKD